MMQKYRNTNIPILNLYICSLEYLHPKTQLPTRRASGDPVLRWMELCYRRYSCDSIATELCQLRAVGGIDVDEAVHVADAEALNIVGGEELPLSAKTENSG
jgi:hypothetical protein